MEIYELAIEKCRVIAFQIPPTIRGIPTTWQGAAYARELFSKRQSDRKKAQEVLKNSSDIEVQWRSETGKVSEVPYKTLEEVQNFYRPVCIGKDGIELLDDVGGIYGFCDMLRTIYGCIPNNDWEQGERERTIGWAGMMGWTGRWIRAERTL